MSKSGLRLSHCASNPSSRVLRTVYLFSCFVLAVGPGLPGTAAGQSDRREIFVPPTKVQVPELRQRSLLEAQQRAQEARLRLEVRGGAPADPSRAVVVEQTPQPNTQVPAGTSITVVVRVSATKQAGPPREVLAPPEGLVIVPELRKRPLLEAQQRVKNAQLRLEVSGGWPEEPSRAMVVDQKPPPDTRVRVGTMVFVHVQRSDEWVLVPELRRQPLLEAQQRVKNARLRLEVAGGWPADPKRAVVVEQKPGQETRVRVDSTVVVVVRVMPAPEEWVLVPELRRRPLLEAQQRVKNARLRLEVAGGWPADPKRAVVVEQKPGQETRVGSDR